MDGDRHLLVEGERLLVVGTDLLTLVRIRHKHELPTLRVRTRWCLYGNLHTFFDDGHRHIAIKVQALTHSSSSRQEFIIG